MNESSSGRVAPGWSPWEVVAAAALVAAVVCGGVVWLGAALAASLVGNRLGVGLVDAIGVLPTLWQHRGDPAAAWPSPARDALPGPWVYWPSTVLAAGLAAALGSVASRLARVNAGRRRLGVDVRARFATRPDLGPLLIRDPVPGRFVLGRCGRWLVATEARRGDSPAGLLGRRNRVGDLTSVAIVGPSRSGKTAQCAIPGVLDWAGPAVLLSVKRDLLDATIHRRRALGEVRVFDPAGVVAVSAAGRVQIDPDEIGRWSPLRIAHTTTGAKKAGAALAAWTPKAGIEGGNDFWASSGEILFTGLLGAASLDPNPSMTTVARWVLSQDMGGTGEHSDITQVLNNAVKDGTPGDVERVDDAALHLGAIWNKDSKFASSVYGTAQTVASPYLDKSVQAATERKRDDPPYLDLDWLLDDAGGRANTIYLVVPLDEYVRLGPVLGGFLSDLKTQAYEWDVAGRRFPSTLLMLIDEAGNMPLKWLPQVASTCAGIGIQLVTIWQSLAQIDEAYGPLANSVITNHPTKLFFPAASDDATLGYQSRIVGDEEVERRSWTADPGRGQRSVSGATQREPLVPYHVPRLAPLGQALLIHGNLPPAVIRGRKWWRKRRLRRLAAPQPRWPGMES